MKKIKSFLLFSSLLIMSVITTLHAQNVWSRMTDFPGVARLNTVSFVIGHNAYVGLGNNGSTPYSDMYKWDQHSNTWSRIADYPGGGDIGPVAFAINGKGYVGLGEDGTPNHYNNLYSYDTTTDSWTAMASLPAAGRYTAGVFVIGHMAYIFAGSFSGPPYTNETWSYDANSNVWSVKNNFPAQVEGLFAFAIGKTGYAGGGWDGSTVHNTCWRYDTITDNWTPIASIPFSTGIIEVSNGFVIGAKGYICTGEDGTTSKIKKGLVYDTLTKGWSVFTSMAAAKISRSYSAEFTVGNCGYICNGQDTTQNSMNSFWQWGPKDTTCHDWTRMADFPGVGRLNTVNFIIGHNAYAGLGNNGSTTYNDMYKWDQNTNIWSRIANYPGGGDIGPVAFAINGKGYVGLGEDGTPNHYNNLYSYDTTTDSWTAMASLPAAGRYTAGVFVIGHMAYIFAGSFSGPPYTNETWSYDANSNVWSVKNNFPAQVEGLFAFAIGKTGYAGGGWDGSTVHNTCWRYDTVTDNWTPIASIPFSTGITEVSNGFVIGTKGYICTGQNDPNSKIQKGLTYDTLTKGWSVFTSMAAARIARSYSTEFAIGNNGYICNGQDTTQSSLNDLWRFHPCAGTPIVTGIIADERKESITLFPNPSSGMIHIEFSGWRREPSELKIMDMMGKLLAVYPMAGRTSIFTADVNSLSNGIYFYQVHSAGQPVSSGKFILAR
jgi:N-acetylneuraminic acid mutarotase